MKLMGVNKVVYDDETLIDLTGDTVSPGTMVRGITATAANGERIVGTLGEATTTSAGLMSATDKSKLNGIAENANNYSLPTASGSVLGGVKTGSNITNSSGTISLTKANVTSALGYTPPTTNTTYGVVSTSADGLAPKRDGSTAKFLRGDGTWAVPPDTNTDTNTTYTFATGDSNGQIKVTPSGGSAQNVSVKGLGSAAYTASTAYATAAQGTLATNALPKAGGTLTGALTAYGGAVGTAQVRNVYFGTSKLTAGSTSSQPEGTMYFSYE